MLERTDRLALAVKERAPAAETFARIFDTEIVEDVQDRTLGAWRMTLQWGQDQLELLEPAGPGPVLDFLEQGHRGIFAGGFSLADPAALAARVGAAGVRVRECGEDRYVILPEHLDGTGVILSRRVERGRVGLNDKIWQITYAVADREQAIDRYTRLFGLEHCFTNRYISNGYGYNGAITWFDARDGGLLDSLEYLEPFDQDKAVARFLRKNGAGIYMASIETDDVAEIARRVSSTGPGWDGAPGSDFGGFIHPLRLHGLLLGLTTYRTWNAQRPLPGRAPDGHAAATGGGQPGE
jgi:hypothetical protein